MMVAGKGFKTPYVTITHGLYKNANSQIEISRRPGLDRTCVTQNSAFNFDGKTCILVLCRLLLDDYHYLDFMLKGFSQNKL